MTELNKSRHVGDLTGKRFMHLTVVRKAPNLQMKSAWWCRCKCGKELPVRQDNLRSGQQISCGCITATRIAQSNKSRKKPEPIPTLIDKTPVRGGFSEEAAADLAKALGML